VRESKKGKAANQPVSWETAIQTVLKQEGSALHYAEIAQKIVDQELRSSVGATPAMTVASILSTSLKDASSPFLRIGGGQYALKQDVEAQTHKVEADDVTTSVEDETGALRAFGMFWQRDQVIWGGKPRLLGRQGLGASHVNFAEQIGVYLLHDRDRVIYVGRAMDTMFARLKAHTTDRLGGRWDRFSWFGLKNVGESGQLMDSAVPWSHTVVMETMEALLIESLEPPLNRKRGDNFSGVEYLQVLDPELEDAKKKALLADMMKASGLS
jgi:hypothetical protein